jgi:hypothetical protein
MTKQYFKFHDIISFLFHFAFPFIFFLSVAFSFHVHVLSFLFSFLRQRFIFSALTPLPPGSACLGGGVSYCMVILTYYYWHYSYLSGCDHNRGVLRSGLPHHLHHQGTDHFKCNLCQPLEHMSIIPAFLHI